MNISVAAPAKINLWLRVGPRQPTGYHELDTLFCTLDLADTLKVRVAPLDSGIRLIADFGPPLEAQPDLGPVSANLAVRAAAAFAARCCDRLDLEIRLRKRIPVGGGLGGGSSDAAAALRALDELFPGAVSEAGLMDLARALGSDVPFFLAGKPVARGLGRGEILQPAPILPPRPVLLLLPPFPVSTAAAYSWLVQARQQGLPGADPAPFPSPAPDAASWDHVADAAANDLEAVVFPRHPLLQVLRDRLRDLGARPALMAGSGSTVFGVFPSDDAARAAAGSVRHAHPQVRAVLTRTRAG
jgi:4-diphosphocytidyl-2-C-methyl-D-erythritol kinase